MCRVLLCCASVYSMYPPFNFPDCPDRATPRPPRTNPNLYSRYSISGYNPSSSTSVCLSIEPDRFPLLLRLPSHSTWTRPGGELGLAWLAQEYSHHPVCPPPPGRGSDWRSSLSIWSWSVLGASGCGPVLRFALSHRQPPNTFCQYRYIAMSRRYWLADWLEWLAAT